LNVADDPIFGEVAESVDWYEAPPVTVEGLVFVVDTDTVTVPDDLFAFVTGVVNVRVPDPVVLDSDPYAELTVYVGVFVKPPKPGV
jgi:hypothetical protein